MQCKTSCRTLYAVVAVLIVLISSFTTANLATAQPVTGTIGKNADAGWMDIAPPVNFARGERLKILIGGTAQRILVRLLPHGSKYDSSDGIIGGAVNVPTGSRVVEILIPEERKNVIQISVHGGLNPFDIALGGGNGPARIVSVERIIPTP